MWWRRSPPLAPAGAPTAGSRRHAHTARTSLTGSYSRLAPDGQTVALRADRQGAAEHGHRITAAIACHVARAGGTVDQRTQLLLHPVHEGGRHTRSIALRSGQTRALD
ncbi:hypothetical protein [Streptomyces soliscabiei]|uniref:hypothetical protein n=1 Tax=Streptomyces soliscabiei TaxID=588897 RepID=UPI0029AAE3E0|nr:hypothetical protein [Streptomyces sp. NY05-11A]MDX2675006.1 hypothetical protein [Streptomyces sp. NY05-11A]